MVVNDSVHVKEIRNATGLTQDKFSKLIDVKMGTLRNWEQGRREPTGAAKALLRLMGQPWRCFTAIMYELIKPML